MFQRIKDNIRARILTIHVSHLYNTIGEEDILKRVGTGWRVGDKEITNQEMQHISNEAKQFLKSKLWQVLQKDIKYRANLKMYEESKGVYDLTFGKMWTYTLDTIETKLNNLIK